MAIFGNQIGGSIRINGQEYKPLRCSCGNTNQWTTYEQTGNTERAECAKCGNKVERKS